MRCCTPKTYVVGGMSLCMHGHITEYSHQYEGIYDFLFLFLKGYCLNIKLVFIKRRKTELNGNDINDYEYCLDSRSLGVKISNS